jgi:hypothetical protein
MSAKKKRQEAFKAKEKKQKIIAGVGGVLLLGLLAFQVPRVMKQMHKGSASAASVPATVSTPTSTSATPSLAAPTTQQEASASTDTSTSGAISADEGATQGQLASFSRFESKDPFAQQVDQTTTVASTDESAASNSGSSSDAGSSGSSSGSSGSSGSGSTGGAQPAPGGAVISVNGVLMSVSTGANFPAATPLFHLISVTSSTAKIAIAGGSYSSGAASVTLHVNKAVTLMNTADGTRYKLILKPQGTPVPGGSTSTGTGTSTTTSTTPATPSTPSP